MSDDIIDLSDPDDVRALEEFVKEQEDKPKKKHKEHDDE